MDNKSNAADIEIRECTTMEEFDACVGLQREVFGLPDLEVSPRRHLIVSRSAGGWCLGAFAHGRVVGFVHTVAAVHGTEISAYSHMMAVAAAYQNRGVGARLKWAQRERAIREGWQFIKWTFEPMRARNAHFNINRLGVSIREYAENYYGTDYHTSPDEQEKKYDLDSDRLMARWELRSPRVTALADGRNAEQSDARAAATIEIPPDWNPLLRDAPHVARRELLRVRQEFQSAFAEGLVCTGFERDAARPRYLLYRDDRP
ncbi:MAG TPA: GNAT family N-acetyltransferase [Pyrinomonadaceae bacterium]|jgi:predicted GNAT superfamily acetyltransferase